MFSLIIPAKLRLGKDGLKTSVLTRINTPYCGGISPVVKLQCDCHLLHYHEFGLYQRALKTRNNLASSIYSRNIVIDTKSRLKYMVWRLNGLFLVVAAILAAILIFGTFQYISKSRHTLPLEYLNKNQK